MPASRLLGALPHKPGRDSKKPQEGRIIAKSIQKICITDTAPRQSLPWPDIMHTGLNRSSINLVEKQGYPLHLSQRSDPTLQWLNSQSNSITELLYWIQYVSYVLFKWQTGINNWCSPSIIIFATLVTWFLSPLPTQHCGVEEHPNPLWDEPTAGGIFTHYIILHMLKRYNQYNMTYFVARVTFFTASWEGGDVTVHINWWFTLWKSN